MKTCDQRIIGRIRSGATVVASSPRSPDSIGAGHFGHFGPAVLGLVRVALDLDELFPGGGGD